MQTSYCVTNKLFLVRQAVAKTAPAKAVDTPTNHVTVFDCSGSMTGELPRIREQMKKRLKSLLKEGDTFSAIWFSGRGETGVLLEAEPVPTLKELSDVEKAIDRWLRPIGLTGFKEPLQEVGKLVERVSKKNKNPFSMLFMSDGCDNVWPRTDILKVVGDVGSKLAAATFVEYGYYADRQLLSSMAERAGGVHIFADAFDKWEPVFEKVMQSRPVGGKRVEIKVAGDPIGGFVWALHDGDLMTFEASSGKALVAEGVDEIAYLSPMSVGQTSALDVIAEAETKRAEATRAGITMNMAKRVETDVSVRHAYAAMSLFSVRMKPDVIFPLLKATGDVEFINRFANCFGKVAISEFMDLAKNAAFKSALRFMAGHNPNLVPPDDAFCVLNLLTALAEDDENRILLDHPEFKYSRISRGRLDAAEHFTAEEQAEVDKITAEMAKTKSAKKLKELQAQLDGITAKKQDALKFVADPAPDGYSIAALTYNEERPNISLLVRKTGTVDLTSCKDGPAGVPVKFPTYIFRNYAIVRDGMVNVEKLPVKLTPTTYNRLVDAGVKMTLNAGALVIDVKSLPIINRKMVTDVSGIRLAQLEYALVQARCAQKVYNHYKKELFPEPPARSIADMYGDDAAAWLDAHGIGRNGFAPKSTVQAESVDFIVGKKMLVALDGYASLPSVNDVKKRMTNGKKPLSGCAQVMAEAINEVEAQKSKADFQRWITDKATTTKNAVRDLLHTKSQIMFAVIVGQTWFTEAKSLDDNTFATKVNGVPVTCTVSLEEEQIKI